MSQLEPPMLATTSKIKRGVPQYWYEPRSGEVTLDETASTMSIPVIGYFDENSDEVKEKILKTICPLQENALLADSYSKEVNCELTVNQKREKLQQYKNQGTDNRQLREVYRNVKIIAIEIAKELGEKRKRDKLQLKFRDFSWLHVRMPDQFNYTGAIMVNHPIQGLLHTFCRHYVDWLKYVPDLDNSFHTLSDDLQEQLNNIQSATNMQTSRQLLNVFLSDLSGFNDDTFTVLYNVQLDIHDFIQNSVTYENYLGEGTNYRGLQQVYFKVKDAKNETNVMTVCVSQQLFPSDLSFFDDRPIRTITTIFFIPWEQYLNNLVTKIF